MGDYITYHDLLGRYPKFQTLYDGNQSFVDSHIIYYAENNLNSLLGTHFSVPFSAAHPTVKDLTIDLCQYRQFLATDPEKAAAIYDLIMTRIELIKDGKEYIYTDSGVLAPSADAEEIWSNTKDYHPVHGMLPPESVYTRIASAQLYDEENERD